MVLLALMAALAAPPVQSPDAVAAVLRRVSEEAEAFARLAPEVISEEVCRQKAARSKRSLHFRLKPGPRPTPEPAYDVREITSEYGFAMLKESGGSLHEFRRIISVDGRPVESAPQARKKLTYALKDANDRERRRLLREFEEKGLEGAAADFGQSILLFTRRRLEDYDFAAVGRENVGPDATLVLAFKQRGGSQAFTIFDRNQMVRQQLEGRLWVREADGRPLRLELRTIRRYGASTVRDLATVDYAMSAHGALMPVSALYRQHLDQQLVVENKFEYGPFRRFSASAEIKFTESEEQPARK